MLYDHRKGSIEYVNVAERPEYADVVRKHQAYLKKLREGWSSSK